MGLLENRKLRKRAEAGDVGAARQLSAKALVKGDKQAAISYLRQVAATGDREAMRSIGKLALEIGDLDTARSFHEQAAAIGEVRSMLALAEIAAAGNDFETQIRWLRSALDAGDVDSRWHLALALAETGATEEAEELISSTSVSSTDPASLYILARVASVRGDREAEGKHLMEAVIPLHMAAMNEILPLLGSSSRVPDLGPSGNTGVSRDFSGRAALRMARLYAESGNVDDAELMLSRSLQTGNRDAAIIVKRRNDARGDRDQALLRLLVDES